MFWLSDCNNSDPSLIYLGDGECWTPLLFEYVQADVAIAVYVWMEDFGFEGYLASVSEEKAEWLKSNPSLSLKINFMEEDP